MEKGWNEVKQTRETKQVQVSAEGENKREPHEKTFREILITGEKSEVKERLVM